MSAFAINEKGDYFIIEEHEIEMLDGFDGFDVGVVGNVGDVGGVVGEELTEVELLGGEEGLERSEKHDEREMQEKCVNSVEKEIENEKEKPIEKSYSCGENWGGNFCNAHRNTRLTTCITSNINTNIREMELKINTSTVEEVIFKKHKVEIINIDTRRIIMGGLYQGIHLLGVFMILISF